MGYGRRMLRYQVPMKLLRHGYVRYEGLWSAKHLATHISKVDVNVCIELPGYFSSPVRGVGVRAR